MIAGHGRPAARDARPGALPMLSARTARAAEASATRREVRPLDDRTLRDIGLSRDAIATLDG